MTPNRNPFQAGARSVAPVLFVGILLGLALAHAGDTLSTLLSKDLEEISRSAVPTPEEVKAQVCATAAATISRHVNLQPGGISAAVYQTTLARIHVQWKDFAFASIQPQSISETDRLNGVTASYRIEYRSQAHRTWKVGHSGWSNWKSSRYRAFSSGITVQKTKGRWVCKRDPNLRFFRPGPGVPVIKTSPKTTDPNLPPGVTPRQAGHFGSP